MRCVKAEVILGIGLFGNVSGELSSAKTRLKRRGCSTAGTDTPMVAGREEKVCDVFFTVCHGRGVSWECRTRSRAFEIA